MVFHGMANKRQLFENYNNLDFLTYDLCFSVIYAKVLM